MLAALALLVTALEAVGAALVYALLSLASSGGEIVPLPVVGDLSERLPGVDARTLQILTAVVVAAFFFTRAAVLVGRANVQARIVLNAGARIANDLVRGYLAMP